MIRMEADERRAEALSPGPLFKILALTLERVETSLFFHVTVTYKQSLGF